MAETLDRKTCMRCGKPKDIKEFYDNPNLDDTGVDAWCKSCLGKCATREDVARYMWENGRDFTKEIWKLAVDRAEPILAKNAVYQKSSKDKQKALLEKAAAGQVQYVMKTDYHYVDTDGVSYEEAKAQGLFNDPKAEEKDEEKVYSKEFHGEFTKDELEYLEDYVADLSEDFDIETRADKDYARKMAKASLIHDNALNDYLAGEADIETVNKAAASFDMIAKSGNLAPSKKKKDDSKSIGSWSELTLYLEMNGHPCTRQVTWPLDDVDKTVMEFRHIVTAMGLDGE